ncbi:MAG: Asp23/Gls24 family envelope stress response protein [Thermaerobacter sp.]|nr:Asp23/Gls24 family envelope stress response protein [Thermaerobacter sp.]
MGEQERPLTNQKTIPVVLIANDVIGTIAGIAATEVDGVAGMSGGLVEGISEKLGKRTSGKGVRVDVTDQMVTLDLFLVVQFGAKIPEVAVRVQDVVKRQVESMTGLGVSSVNIHVQGVAISPGGPEDPESAE